MEFKSVAENKETEIRVEIDLTWSISTESFGRCVGKIRIFEKGLLKQFESCYNSKKAIESYDKMKEEFKLTETIRNESVDYAKEQQQMKERIETLRIYGKNVPKAEQVC